MSNDIVTKVGSIDTINSPGTKTIDTKSKIGKVEPELKINGEGKTNLYNTDAIQVVVQENSSYIPNKNALKPKNKKFGAGFNAHHINKSLIDRGQDDYLIKMATKDAKQRSQIRTVNINNIQNVTDI